MLAPSSPVCLATLCFPFASSSWFLTSWISHSLSKLAETPPPANAPLFPAKIREEDAVLRKEPLHNKEFCSSEGPLNDELALPMHFNLLPLIGRRNPWRGEIPHWWSSENLIPVEKLKPGAKPGAKPWERNHKDLRGRHEGFEAAVVARSALFEV